MSKFGKARSDVTEEYLGDGLYVSFDGFMFTLRAPRGWKVEDSWVGLEPEVLDAFLRFVRKTQKNLTEEKKQ